MLFLQKWIDEQKKIRDASAFSPFATPDKYYRQGFWAALAEVEKRIDRTPPPATAAMLEYFRSLLTNIPSAPSALILRFDVDAILAEWPEPKPKEDA